MNRLKIFIIAAVVVGALAGVLNFQQSQPSSEDFTRPEPEQPKVDVLTSSSDEEVVQEQQQTLEQAVDAQTGDIKSSDNVAQLVQELSRNEGIVETLASQAFQLQDFDRFVDRVGITSDAPEVTTSFNEQLTQLLIQYPQVFRSSAGCNENLCVAAFTYLDDSSPEAFLRALEQGFDRPVAISSQLVQVDGHEEVRVLIHHQAPRIILSQ